MRAAGAGSIGNYPSCDCRRQDRRPAHHAALSLARGRRVKFGFGIADIASCPFRRTPSDPMLAPDASASLAHPAEETPIRAPDSDAVAAFRTAVVDKLTYMVGRDTGFARHHDWLMATALAVRDRIIDRWRDATRKTFRDGRKRVYYFSLEFLIGRMLFDALGNLGLTETAREALRELGVDLDRLRALEPDAALGNGGLGRLAACFLESMATLGIAAHGYGIRYDHGTFRQVLRDGWQQELPEEWLSFGNPWEFERPEVSYTVGFGGKVEESKSPGG